MSDAVKIIEDDELERLLMAVVGGTETLTRPDLDKRAERVAAWAVQTRLDHAMLHLVLSGEMDIVVPADPSANLKFRKAKP